MKTIKVQELTVENFAKYGAFGDMLNPSGPFLGAEPSVFYRDMVMLGLGPANEAAFSVCRVTKSADVVTNIEYHKYTGEGILPLDGDVNLVFAPATANGDVPFDRLEVFRAPKGTFVAIRPGVWHCGAFAREGVVSVLIVLPQRTYANDCVVVRIPEGEQSGIGS